MLATIRQINTLGNYLQSQGQHQQARSIHEAVQKMLADDIPVMHVTDSLWADILQAEKNSKT